MSQELTPPPSVHANADRGAIGGAPSSSQPGSAGGSSLQATHQLIEHARTELGRVISGQTPVIEEVLMAVLCQGHALLEGVPGIAKTLIVKALGRLLGLGFQRVQATPDLMPADILGTSILRPGTDTFSFHAGAGVYGSAAGGRDQPHASADPGRAAGVHGRAAGDERRSAAAAARRGSRCSPRRTRWISKAPIRCPRRSSTVFC